MIISGITVGEYMTIREAHREMIRLDKGAHNEI